MNIGKLLSGITQFGVRDGIKTGCAVAQACIIAWTLKDVLDKSTANPEVDDPVYRL